MFNWIRRFFAKKEDLTYPPIELQEDPYISNLQDALGNGAKVWVDPVTGHYLWETVEQPVDTKD